MNDGKVWGNLSITFRAKKPKRLAEVGSNGT